MKTQEALNLLERWSEADLGDMFGLMCIYKEMGHAKVQVDVEHMHDIVLMAIEYLKNAEKQ